MKKSVEILGLPIISITEGRELGTSKTLLIDAKNRVVAAITIEDDDWYRGVKLIPYESVIAIGEDAVTITHSENILTLEEAGDYERFLDENIRVIGTKAITKTGRIQGKVSEVFIGDGGKIVKCEITTPEGMIDEVDAEQISIFGKQVTVVDLGEEKKNNFVSPVVKEQPAFEPAFQPAVDNFREPQAVWTPPEEPEVTEPVEEIPSTPDVPETSDDNFPTPEETQPDLENFLTPEPETETPDEPFTPFTSEPPVEDIPAVEVEENPHEEITLPNIPVVTEMPDFTEPPVETPVEDPRLTELTKQAQELKDALETAKGNSPAPEPQPEPEPEPPTPTLPKTGGRRPTGGKAIDERRRKILLGKHATKTIMADSGTIVVEAGAEVTEEVLQRARLANKFIELSMNVQ